MAVTIETLSELERRVHLNVGVEQINATMEARLKAWARSVKMPGFRPGKVPLKMVAQQYGAQARSEAIQESLDRAFSQALEGSNLRVAGQPRVESKEGATNPSEFEFTATFEVYPTVHVADPASLQIERPTSVVEEADVDRTVDTLRKQRVTYKTVDRAANSGDRLMVDFAGTIDGVAFDGGSAKNFALIVGEGRMLPQFESAMPGMAKGGTRMFDVDFPADYPGAAVAGKKATFEATALEVAEPILPALDSAFAKAFGIADGDISKLRAEVRQNLELELKRRVFSLTRNQVLKSLRDATPVAVPNSLAANEALRMAQSAQEEMVQRGASKEEAQVSPATFESAARERVALGLLVSEAVRRNGLHATPAQVQQLVAESATSYEKPEQVISWYSQDKQRLAEFEALALESNVVQWVMSKAKVVDKPVAFTEIMGQNVGQA